MHLITTTMNQRSFCINNRKQPDNRQPFTVVSVVTLCLLAGNVLANSPANTDTQLHAIDVKHYSSVEGMNSDPWLPDPNITSSFKRTGSIEPEWDTVPSDYRSTQASSVNPPSTNHWDHHHWFDSDTWITDIGTLLYRDDDGDGYYSGFSLTIDADTHYHRADIYAAIDIQRVVGTRERLHTSQTFTVYNDSNADEYRIDIDLLSNYAAGDYDLHIDIHDAYNHTVLDSVGAALFSNLSRLPLESSDLEYHVIDEHEYDQNSSQQPVNDDIRVVEYTGSSGIPVLLFLLVAGLMRRGWSRQ